MDEKKLFEKLDKITKLLGASVIQGKSFKDQVRLLSEVGLQPGEISEITGKSTNFVSVTKNNLKKVKKDDN